MPGSNHRFRNAQHAMSVCRLLPEGLFKIAEDANDLARPNTTLSRPDPSTAGTFRKKFRQNSGKTPQRSEASRAFPELSPPQYGWGRLLFQKWFRRGPLRAAQEIPSNTEACLIKRVLAFLIEVGEIARPISTLFPAATSESSTWIECSSARVSRWLPLLVWCHIIVLGSRTLSLYLFHCLCLCIYACLGPFTCHVTCVCISPSTHLSIHLSIYLQKTFRYLWRVYSLLFCGFFVAFPWLFHGPLLSRKTVFGPFSWLFRGPRFGQNLRALALEQSSDIYYYS